MEKMLRACIALFTLPVGAVAMQQRTISESERRSHRLVFPEKKLAFCYIPKVASKDFTNLFDDLSGRPHKFQEATDMGMGVDWGNVTKENGWRFAFFTRDPLERYLSAFASKCMINAMGRLEDWGRNCYGDVLRQEEPLDTMVAAFKERVKFDSERGPATWNEHWALQHSVLEECGEDKFHPDRVDFRGDLQQDINPQVRAMLDMVGVANSSSFADRYFPGFVLGHRSKSHNRTADFYADAATVRTAMTFLEDDYKYFNLTLPDFARDKLSNAA